VLDLGAKKNAYRRNGVQEYLVWQTFENHLSWFRLQNEEFISIEPDVEGIIRSSIFPGLWLDVPALLADTMMDVLNILQAGIADSAHEAFVQSLVNRASG
jgi:Uma2 family endonuclease